GRPETRGVDAEEDEAGDVPDLDRVDELLIRREGALGDHVIIHSAQLFFGFGEETEGVAAGLVAFPREDVEEVSGGAVADQFDFEAVGTGANGFHAIAASDVEGTVGMWVGLARWLADEASEEAVAGVAAIRVSLKVAAVGPAR